MKNWLSHPDKKDPADIAPEGYSDNQETAKADVFFIHPTLYFRRENWNSPLKENSGTEELLRFDVANQASVFNGSCRVYAPHYR